MPRLMLNVPVLSTCINLSCPDRPSRFRVTGRWALIRVPNMISGVPGYHHRPADVELPQTVLGKAPVHDLGCGQSLALMGQ